MNIFINTVVCRIRLLAGRERNKPIGSISGRHVVLRDDLHLHRCVELLRQPFYRMLF